jgi:ankyrin repeat protein
VYKGGTLLDVFIRFCDENIIKLVLQAGVKYNNSYPPLQVAVRFKKLNVVKLLLNHFGRYIVNIQRESWGNRTALHQAVLGEINEDIIEMLLDNGAKTDIKDDDGFTPLELMESNLEKLKPTDPGYDYYLRLLNLLKGIKTPENKNPEYYI